MSEQHPDPVATRHPVVIPTGRLWFAILAPPAVWIAQGALGWFFGERMCTSMSMTTVRMVLAVISLAALGTAVAAMAIGWQNWQRTSSDPDPRDFKAVDRMDFMAASGFLVSGVFVLGITWAGLSSVLINVCGGTR